MSKPETIRIDDTEYVRSDAQPQTAGEIKIVVADRGFVYIGKLPAVEQTSDFTVIRCAHNIRIWGTTKGLGELVNGPTSKTVLDRVGTVRVPNRAVISLIDVEQAKWKLQ